MSSAGHIMDMINRVKQNRAFQASKKDMFKEKRGQISDYKKTYYVPDPPREKIKNSVFLEYFNGLFVLIMVILLVYLMMT